MMQMIQLIFILICLSILTGMIWWKACLILEEESGEPGFISSYGFNSEEFDATIEITLSYFLFTTLSTVGLGDYHPTTSAERVMGSVIFLFGVLTTSYVNENLLRMIKQIRQLDNDYEESDKLSVFLSVMKKFNQNESLSTA